MQFNSFSLTVAVTKTIAGLALVVLLAGCANTPRWGGWSTRPTQAQIESGLRQLDIYVYYPRYQVYFNPARDQYTFQDQGRWVTRATPHWGTPAELLELTPSVAMRFDDAPEGHHVAVSRLYPSDWTDSKADLVSLR